MHAALALPSRRIAATLAVLLAVLVMPAWGTGAPAIDWAELPPGPVEVIEGTTVQRCSVDEAVLCLTADAAPGGGGIEHLSFPVGTIPELASALAAGATERQALEAHADAYHELFAEDRADGCPPGHRYLAGPTRPATVAQHEGVSYEFTLLDAAGDVAERWITYAAITGGGADGRQEAPTLHLFVAHALGDGACVEPLGYPFTPDGLAAVAPTVAQLVAHSVLPPTAGARNVVVVPRGGDGVTYDETSPPPVGPSAIEVDAAGTTWIVDVEARRLLRVGADGTLLEPVDLSAHGVQSLLDLDVRGDGFVLLDVDAANTHRLLLLDGAGQVTATHVLPPEAHVAQGLTGLAVVDGDAVVAELEGGARLIQVLDAQGEPTAQPVDGYRLHGRTYDVRPAEGDQPRAVVVDGRVIEVRTDHDPASLHLLHVDPDGSFLVVVEELGPSEERIEVDRTVRRYTADGRLLATARDHLRERYTVVEKPFAVAPGGTVVALTTREPHAELTPLRFTPRLEPIFEPRHRVEHLAADDRVGTAIAVSHRAHPAGSVTRALIARDDVFADALASGGVQGMLDAPLLLTASTRLDDRVLAELHRLGAREVTVLGGEAAIGPEVVTALETAGLVVHRIGGATRVDTAVALAQANAPTARRAVLVRADGPEATQAYADALAAGALAAAAGDPVLLTASDHLSPQVRDLLIEAGVREVVVAGGEAAIAAPVVAALEELDIAVDRAAGEERAATAVALAARRAAPTGAHADAVILVDGREWVDGLAAASLSAQLAAPVLITDGAAVPQATAQYLAAAQHPPVVICTPSVAAAACG